MIFQNRQSTGTAFCVSQRDEISVADMNHFDPDPVFNFNQILPYFF